MKKRHLESDAIFGGIPYLLVNSQGLVSASRIFFTARRSNVDAATYATVHNHLYFQCLHEPHFIKMGHVNPPEGGFWQLGEFSGNNIWSDGSKMAPFDQNFYFIINVAVGGNFFPDGCTNAYGNKPWDGYNVPGSMKRFWEARQNWLPTWDMGSDERALKVDYIRVWSL